jgi:hypothetical protein
MRLGGKRRKEIKISGESDWDFEYLSEFGTVFQNLFMRNL